jgi:hypothetical protein
VSTVLLCDITAFLTSFLATGKVITTIAEGTAQDVDRAVAAAKHAYESSWGLKVPGAQRGKLLNKLADLIETHADELASLEALDNGKTFSSARAIDLEMTIGTIRYYGGWADKIHGQVIETHEGKLTYTRHEPIGVVGQIIPWNFPRMWNLRVHLSLCALFCPSDLLPNSINDGLEDRSGTCHWELYCSQAFGIHPSNCSARVLAYQPGRFPTGCG